MSKVTLKDNKKVIDYRFELDLKEHADTQLKWYNRSLQCFTDFGEVFYYCEWFNGKFLSKQLKEEFSLLILKP